MKKYYSLFFALFLLLIGVVFFRGSTSHLISSIQSPLVQIGTWLNVKTDFIFRRDECTFKHLQTLEKERRSLAINKTELENLRQENSLLKKQLAFTERNYYQIKTARIISRSTTKYSTKFKIDQGLEDGIGLGNPVMVGGGNLVGKVSEVKKYTATVTGITDLNMAMAASLLNSTNTLGVAQGTIGDLMNLKFIPKNQKIEVNDLVVTSGLEDGMPSGLLIGIITLVEPGVNGSFQKAIIEPMIKSSDYSLVSVIINNKNYE